MINGARLFSAPSPVDWSSGLERISSPPPDASHRHIIPDHPASFGKVFLLRHDRHKYSQTEGGRDMSLGEAGISRRLQNPANYHKIGRLI
jgi:hypothetical protein